MRAGFNWEMGPFQLWDAAGVPATVERMKAAGEPVSANVERLLAAGAGSWYRNHGRECFDLAQRRLPARCARPPASRGSPTSGRRTAWCKQNPGASLVDLGDGVACIELHSKKNAIGEDIVRLVTETLRRDSEAVRNFEAFVISGDADHFSVGANLMQLAAERPGRRVGRSRSDGARLPAHDRGHQVLPAAGGGGAVRLLPRRRRGDRAARRAPAGPRGALHGAGGDRRGPAARRAAAARR